MAYSTSALRLLPIADQISAVHAGQATPAQLGPNARVIYDAGGISTAEPTAAAVAAAGLAAFQAEEARAAQEAAPAARAASAAPPPQGTTGVTGPTGGPSGTTGSKPPQGSTGAGGPSGTYTPPKQYKSALPPFPGTANQRKTNAAWEYARTTFNQTLPQQQTNLRALQNRPVRGL